MTFTAVEKKEIMKDFQLSETDTGSTSVQVALLTARIKHLTEHLKTHKGDNHSRLGLLKLVSQRKSLLNYLKKSDFDRYGKLLKELGIRH